MVAYSTVLASNAQIAEHTSKPFVAIFAGATTGIGEATLFTLIKYVPEPRIYLFARNESSAERVIANCRQINARGQYTFVEADLSSIKETDQACEYVKKKETSVNLAFLSAGVIVFDGVTPEGLNLFMAAALYSRVHIARQMLPLLATAASSGELARVIDIAAGTYEGEMDVSDISATNVPFAQIRPHVSSLHTLALESLQEQAPEVSFMHNFPGTVLTDLHKDIPGVRGWFVAIMFPLVYWLFGRWLFVEIEECSERQVYFITSDKYKASQGRSAGVPLNNEAVAEGSNGTAASGVYSTNWDGGERTKESLKCLQRFRNDGIKEQVWSHITDELDRITGRAK